MDERTRVASYLTDRVEPPAGPILVCTRSSLRDLDPIEELSVVVVSDRSPLAEIVETMDVNERGFDPAALPVSDETAEAFRDSLRGCEAVTVRWRGRAVAGGMYLPIRARVTELAGIATLTEHRGRGFGAVATATVCQAAFDAGADLAFLATDNAVARRVYERVGFREV